MDVNQIGQMCVGSNDYKLGDIHLIWWTIKNIDLPFRIASQILCG